MGVDCMARLQALRKPDADFVEAACWAISQLPSTPQLPQELETESAAELGWDAAETSRELRILHAQLAAALSEEGTAALLELLVTAILYSSAQAATSAAQPQPAAVAWHQCSPSPLLCRVAQQLVGIPGRPDGTAALPRWALVHLSSLWPGEVAAAMVACVACAGTGMPDTAGVLCTATVPFASCYLLHDQAGGKAEALFASL